MERDYLRAQAWLLETSLHWGRMAEDLPHFASGAFLARQQRAIAALMHTREPRLASYLRALHSVTVRHFSSDGLHCLVIDQQTERMLMTRHYWTGKVITQQRFGDTALVYRMSYDLQDRRWKIDQLVQELPPAFGPSPPPECRWRQPCHWGADATGNQKREPDILRSLFSLY